MHKRYEFVICVNLCKIGSDEFVVLDGHFLIECLAMILLVLLVIDQNRRDFIIYSSFPLIRISLICLGFLSSANG